MGTSGSYLVDSEVAVIPHLEVGILPAEERHIAVVADTVVVPVAEQVAASVVARDALPSVVAVAASVVVLPAVG